MNVPNATTLKKTNLEDLKMCKCCKDCEDRHEACHDTCEIYKKWKADYDEEENRKKKTAYENRILYGRRGRCI